MESIYLKDSEDQWSPSLYMDKKGYDVVGTSGRGGVEGWADVAADRSDVVLNIRNRETGETDKFDIYQFLRSKGVEPDVEKTFEVEKERIQIENEKAERKGVEDKMKEFEEEFRIDFTGIESKSFLKGPEATEDSDTGSKMDLLGATLFPYSRTLEKSGKYDEKWGGWFPKKYGSAAMDALSLIVRTPVAIIDDTLYKATNKKMGEPFITSMATVPDYGLQKSKDKPEEDESIGEHFSALQEAFRFDPLRVQKDLARESIRDPLSGATVLATVLSGGAAAPAAGTRAAIIVASLAKKYKAVHKVKTAAQLAQKTKTAQGFKKSTDLIRKVNDKIERMNPVGRAMTKTGLAVTAEGGLGAVQGYMGKIFMGGDATYKDALVEGIEEGAFGLFASTFLGIPRAAWSEMHPNQKFEVLDDLRDKVKAVELKIDEGTDVSTLSLEEGRLVALTKHGEGGGKIDLGPTAPDPVNVTPEGDLVVESGGEPKIIPLTEELPVNVDKNDVQKKRENPGHVDKGTKAADAREKTQRVENSKMIKAAKKEQTAFDNEVQKGIDDAVNDAVNETEAETIEAEKSAEEKKDTDTKNLEDIFDPSKNTEFRKFQEVLGTGMSLEEQQASFANFKVGEQKATQYLEEVKTETEGRTKARTDLITAGKKAKGQSKLDSDKQVEVQRNSLETQVISDPNDPMYTEGVSATMLPDEFTSQGVYYKKVNISKKVQEETGGNLVRIKDINGRTFDFNNEQTIFMDPQHLDPMQPQATENFTEDQMEFAEMMAGRTAGFESAIGARKPEVAADPIVVEGPTELDTFMESQKVPESSMEPVASIEAVPQPRGRASESAFKETDKAATEAVKEKAAEYISEISPMIESLRLKAKPTDGDLKAVAIAEFLHEKRVDIDQSLADRAKVRQKLKKLNEKTDTILERLSRVGQTRADKINAHKKRIDEWNNDPSIMTPPPKAPILSAQDGVSQKAYLDLEENSLKIDTAEKDLDQFDGIDELDFENQHSFKMLQKAQASGFKSFKNATIGERPKKFAENVSTKKWNKRLEEIKRWDVKSNAIEELYFASFPGLHSTSPELTDMVAKLAWKGTVPRTMKAAKNSADKWMNGQGGFITTGVFREAAKFGAFSFLAGGPLGGLAVHIGYNFLTPIFKKSFSSGLGTYTLHSVRAQMLSKKAFHRVVPKMDQAFHLKNNRTNKYMFEYKKATKGLDAKEKIVMRDFIEGRVKTAPVEVEQAAERVRTLFNRVAYLANEHGWNFKADNNYFTRVLNFDAVQEMKSEDGGALFENEVQNLMQNENMSREQAAATLVSFYDNSAEMRSVKNKKERSDFYAAALKKAGSNPKAFHFIVTKQKARMAESVIGSLSHSRRAPRLTNAMYVEDVDAVMESYIHGTMQAITYREKFGEGLSVINNALQSEFGKVNEKTKASGEVVTRKTGELTQEGERFKEYVEAELYNRSLVLKWGADPKAFSAKAAAGFTRYQFWSKLMTSVLSPVRNTITAGVMSTSIHGVSASGMGLLRTFGGLVKGEPFRNAHLAGAITDQTMKDATGADLFEKARFEKALETIHPFTISEKFVRSFAYNAGITVSKRLFKKALKGNTSAAITLNYYVGEKRITRDIAAGELSEESMELMAAQAASEVAGHARVMNLSPFLSTAEGKLVGQYRRIALHQTVVFKDKIWGPATRGNIAPLLRWGAAVGIAAPAMMALSAMVYGERDEEEMSTPGGKAYGLLSYINQVNSLGLFGDLAASFENGTGFGETPVVGTFVGPTISSIINAAADISSIVTEGREPGEVLSELVKKEFPGVSQAANVFEIESLQK